MALFGSKKNTEDKPEAKAPKAVKKSAKAAPKSEGNAHRRDVSHVLRHPRITEKASILSEGSVYVFDVDTRANKRDVMDAVRFYYKAEPVRIHMVKVPSKNVFIRGKRGVKSGGKKAYVYLKKGETIEVI